MSALAVVVLVSAAAAPVPVPGPLERAKQAIQGEWQVVEAVGGGRQHPVRRAKIVVAGDRLELHNPDPMGTVVFTLDPAANPSAIDLGPTDGTKPGLLKGIYSLNNDRLILCLELTDGAERPKEFKSPKDSTIMLYTLERVKK